MKENRIFFKNNPWPEGHRIKEFKWTAEIRGGEVWCQLHLETHDYNSERKIAYDDGESANSDWEAPIVWGNYHSCTLSSDEWHIGGFRVCNVEEYSSDFLNGRLFRVDPLPFDLEQKDPEELGFYIYLLGHDMVVDHYIQFRRNPTNDLFDLNWRGKIAMAYGGDFEPKYDFRAVVHGLELPELEDA